MPYADFEPVSVFRRISTVLLAALAAASILAGPAAAAESDVVIDGGGWGHGIGMSQYGAYGQALEGRTAEEIVGYYYEGSDTGALADQVGAESWLVTDSRPLWVSLLTGRKVFAFEAVGGSLTVCHSGSGGCAYTATPGQSWKFETLGDGTCRFVADGVEATPPGNCNGSIKGLSPGGAHVVVSALAGDRNEFARGALRIRTPDSGESFHVALEIGLEQYLYGLAEVPFSWHPEALRAQALAGRSYAAWRLISRGPEAEFSASRKSSCWCHMSATTADQSYRGWNVEDVAEAAAWRAAVDDTAGIVITHPDASQANVVAAFYSSSTGGSTENNEDIWGGNAVSYLRAKPDPWSQSSAVNNPFAAWSYSFDEATLATAYGVDKVDGIAIKSRFDSGTPSSVTVFARSGGAKTTIQTSGPAMYATLGLRGRNISRLDYGTVPTVAADFTGDGKADVAAITPFSNSWWVGAGGGGGFVESSWRNLTASGLAVEQVTGDFDGDGRTDLAVLDDSGKLRVGLSTGTRFAVQRWAAHTDPARWGSLLVGDFTGNGVDDLAEYDAAAARWRVYHLEAGELVKDIWYDFSVADPVWAAHGSGDFNGDGLADIVSLDAHSGDLIVLFSNGESLAPVQWQQLPGSVDDLMLTGDFTGDGIDDTAAFDSAAAAWWVVPGTSGAAGASPQPWFTFGDAGQVFKFQVAGDFTGDGVADIAAYRADGTVKVLRSRGTAFKLKIWGEVPAGNGIKAVHEADLNGDGTADLVLWNNRARRWWGASSTGEAFDVAKWGKLL